MENRLIYTVSEDMVKTDTVKKKIVLLDIFPEFQHPDADGKAVNRPVFFLKKPTVK